MPMAHVNFRGLLIAAMTSGYESKLMLRNFETNNKFDLLVILYDKEH
jgi:hypothetical protein